MKTQGQIILASSSPRRIDMLKSLGIEPMIIKPEIDESILQGETPFVYAKRMAYDKAKSAKKGITLKDKFWIISADTVVVSEGKILGKPKDKSDAKRMLLGLSGRTHKVITAFCIMGKEQSILRFESVESYVTFRQIKEAEINWYISTNEPMDKAGAYGVQGCGGVLIDGIEGSFNNVVGLPISRLVVVLEELGALNF